MFCTQFHPNPTIIAVNGGLYHNFMQFCTIFNDSDNYSTQRGDFMQFLHQISLILTYIAPVGGILGSKTHTISHKTHTNHHTISHTNHTISTQFDNYSTNGGCFMGNFHHFSTQFDIYSNNGVHLWGFSSHFTHI